MALQTTGPISFSQIQDEFGGDNPISLGEYYRGGGFVPNGPTQNANISTAGAISLGAFLGSINKFLLNIVSNQTNVNLRSAAINAGWDGNSPLQVVINQGVVISGNTAGNSTAALTINGSFPNGVTLVNKGEIRGRGGRGGNGATGGTNQTNPPTGGGKGGRALIVSVPVKISNQGVIGAGGGGGGGGRLLSIYVNKTTTHHYAGGGGGGGQSSNINSSGGTGYRSGGTGTLASYGGGGAGAPYANVRAGNGGRGGSTGASGATGGASTAGGPAGASGGAGGQAINGNSYITWLATGTRLGSIH